MEFNLNRLKAERIARGLTLADVAEIIDMSESGYSRVESGKRKLTLDKFVKVITFMNIDLTNISIFFN